jgi:hypothetical protein
MQHAGVGEPDALGDSRDGRALDAAGAEQAGGGVDDLIDGGLRWPAEPGTAALLIR